MRTESTCSLNDLRDSEASASHALTVEYGAKLASIEIALGSILQAFHIPFGGHALSLNQAIFLTRAVRRAEDSEKAIFLPLYTSTVVAVLKSLAPMGKKLGPMLAISAQGLLYSFGLLLGGSGRSGVLLAFLLSSLWAFIQPLLTLYLFFGRTLLDALTITFERISEETRLPFIVCLLILPLLKVGIALLLAWRVSKWNSEDEARYMARLQTWAKKVDTKPYNMSSAPTLRERLRLALRDMCRPIFLVSIALLILFMSLQEKSKVEIFWWTLRPLALAFLFSYASRSTMIREMFQGLKRSGFCPKFFANLEATLRKFERHH